MLYLVSTPIGNLEDLSLRALRVLKEVDLILCEDTRHTGKLLAHFEISRPLLSYHKFNEAQREEEIVVRLRESQKVALVSDAGTPGIADPAQRLVARCVEEGLPVSPIPGPCAAVAALCGSGLATNRFQFLGFVPKKPGERRRFVLEALDYAGTSVCYESPNRLSDTLREFEKVAPKRCLVVARELTKRYEEFKRGLPTDLLLHWKDQTVRGEIVLLVEGRDLTALASEEEAGRLVERLIETYGLEKKEAIKMAATLTNLPKKLLYHM